MGKRGQGGNRQLPRNKRIPHAMTHRKRNDDWSDENILWALQARDVGWTMTQIEGRDDNENV